MFLKFPKHAVLAVGLAGAMVVAVGAAQAADMATPEMLSFNCAGCHGPEGTSVGPASPTIAGQSEEYFSLTMEGYSLEPGEEGYRPSTIMGRIVAGYSSEQIEAMGAYFAKQEFGRPDQPFDAAMAAKGKRLQRKYCGRCHEDGGYEGDEDIPILAGQWKPFLAAVMVEFESGEREMSRKKARQLKKLRRKEGDAGLEAILEFHASQR